ncbi:MAG: RNA polymerase sigma factor [Candidatus Rifleibacteriota bacterium]
MMDDQKAIKLAKEKREEGFRALFTNHSKFLFTHALRFLRNRENAEDVVQETFKDAFRYIQSFKGNSSLRTWLYTILYRKALKRINKDKQKTLEPVNDSKQQQYKDAEQKLDTREILNQLPENDRALLMLAYWDELKLEEIGEILGLTLTNTKVRLFRARKRFAELWIKTHQKGEIANEM